MYCPHCSEDINLWSLFKTYLRSKVPHKYDARIEAHILESQRKALAALYSPAGALKLTEREQFVCSGRVAGTSLEDIAGHMNVTRERVRQIEAKALRKLQR